MPLRLPLPTFRKQSVSSTNSSTSPQISPTEPIQPPTPTSFNSYTSNPTNARPVKKDGGGGGGGGGGFFRSKKVVANTSAGVNDEFVTSPDTTGGLVTSIGDDGDYEALPPPPSRKKLFSLGSSARSSSSSLVQQASSAASTRGSIYVASPTAADSRSLLAPSPSPSSVGRKAGSKWFNRKRTVSTKSKNMDDLDFLDDVVSVSRLETEGGQNGSFALRSFRAVSGGASASVALDQDNYNYNSERSKTLPLSQLDTKSPIAAPTTTPNPAGQPGQPTTGSSGSISVAKFRAPAARSSSSLGSFSSLRGVGSPGEQPHEGLRLDLPEIRPSSPRSTRQTSGLGGGSRRPSFESTRRVSYAGSLTQPGLFASAMGSGNVYGGSKAKSVDDLTRSGRGLMNGGGVRGRAGDEDEDEDEDDDDEDDSPLFAPPRPAFLRKEVGSGRGNHSRDSSHSSVNSFHSNIAPPPQLQQQNQVRTNRTMSSSSMARPQILPQSRYDPTPPARPRGMSQSGGLRLSTSRRSSFEGGNSGWHTAPQSSDDEEDDEEALQISDGEIPANATDRQGAEAAKKGDEPQSILDGYYQTSPLSSPDWRSRPKPNEATAVGGGLPNPKSPNLTAGPSPGPPPALPPQLPEFEPLLVPRRTKSPESIPTPPLSQAQVPVDGPGSPSRMASFASEDGPLPPRKPSKSSSPLPPSILKKPSSATSSPSLSPTLPFQSTTTTTTTTTRPRVSPGQTSKRSDDSSDDDEVPLARLHSRSTSSLQVPNLVLGESAQSESPRMPPQGSNRNDEGVVSGQHDVEKEEVEVLLSGDGQGDLDKVKATATPRESGKEHAEVAVANPATASSLSSDKREESRTVEPEKVEEVAPVDFTSQRNVTSTEALQAPTPSDPTPLKPIEAPIKESSNPTPTEPVTRAPSVSRPHAPPMASRSLSAFSTQTMSSNAIQATDPSMMPPMRPLGIQHSNTAPSASSTQQHIPTLSVPAIPQVKSSSQSQADTLASLMMTSSGPSGVDPRMTVPYPYPPPQPAYSSVLRSSPASSTSGSGSASSSLLRTPDSVSSSFPSIASGTAPSRIGGVMMGAAPSMEKEKSVSFDLNSSALGDRRSNLISKVGIPKHGYTGSLAGMQPPKNMAVDETGRSRMRTVSGTGRAISDAGWEGPRPNRESLAPSARTSANLNSSSALSSKASAATAAGGVHERMKERHRAEARAAIQVGNDLHGPGPKLDDDGDEEEEEVLGKIYGGTPLTALGMGMGGMSTMGSMYGPAGPASHSPYMHGGVGGGVGFPSMGYGMPMMGMPGGGGMMNLASAPPGVDPMLFASLPPDQRLALHQRAQQMMGLMAQAAQDAWEKESAVGGGSRIGGSGGDGSGMPMGGGTATRHARSSSLSSNATLGGGGWQGMNNMGMVNPMMQQMGMYSGGWEGMGGMPAGMPMGMPYGYGVYPPHSTRPGSFYGGGYAGSALGVPTGRTAGGGGIGMGGAGGRGGSASVMGVPTSRPSAARRMSRGP